MRHSMKRWIEYVAFLLLGASIASAAYVSGIPGGWYPVGIFTAPEVKAAGEGPIFTAEGEVVDNRCYFVRVPGEGNLYFDPQNPQTPAEVSSDAVLGRATSENCQRDPVGRLWCSPSRGTLGTEELKEVYESRYLPR
jgi:hypothetical protein